MRIHSGRIKLVLALVATFLTQLQHSQAAKYCFNCRGDECRTEGVGHIETCVRKDDVCLTWRHRVDVPSKGLKAGDVYKQGCYLVLFQIDGCMQDGKYDRCLCTTGNYDCIDNKFQTPSTTPALKTSSPSAKSATQRGRSFGGADLVKHTPKPVTRKTSTIFTVRTTTPTSRPHTQKPVTRETSTIFTVLRTTSTSGPHTPKPVTMETTTTFTVPETTSTSRSHTTNTTTTGNKKRLDKSRPKMLQRSLVRDTSEETKRRYSSSSSEEMATGPHTHSLNHHGQTLKPNLERTASIAKPPPDNGMGQPKNQFEEKGFTKNPDHSTKAATEFPATSGVYNNLFNGGTGDTHYTEQGNEYILKSTQMPEIKFPRSTEIGSQNTQKPESKLFIPSEKTNHAVQKPNVEISTQTTVTTNKGTKKFDFKLSSPIETTTHETQLKHSTILGITTPGTQKTEVDFHASTDHDNLPNQKSDIQQNRAFYTSPIGSTTQGTQKREFGTPTGETTKGTNKPKFTFSITTHVTPKPHSEFVVTTGATQETQLPEFPSNGFQRKEGKLQPVIQSTAPTTSSTTEVPATSILPVSSTSTKTKKSKKRKKGKKTTTRDPEMQRLWDQYATSLYGDDDADFP